LSAFEKFGFPVYWHELRRSPDHFWQYCRPFGRLDEDIPI